MLRHTIMIVSLFDNNRGITMTAPHAMRRRFPDSSHGIAVQLGLVSHRDALAYNEEKAEAVSANLSLLR